MTARHAKTEELPVISKAAVSVGQALIHVSNALARLQTAERVLAGQSLVAELRIAAGPLVAFEGRLRQELLQEASK